MIKRGYISPEEVQELHKMKRQISSLMGKSGILINSKTISGQIECIQDYASNYRENPGDAKRTIDVAYGLGEYFAENVLKKYRWEYCTLTFEEEKKWFAVVSSDEKFAILIHNYIYGLLTDKNKVVNISLLFNMLDPDSLKQYETDEKYQILS